MVTSFYDNYACDKGQYDDLHAFGQSGYGTRYFNHRFSVNDYSTILWRWPLEEEDEDLRKFPGGEIEDYEMKE